jgi:hypothetical protein
MYTHGRPHATTGAARGRAGLARQARTRRGRTRRCALALSSWSVRIAEGCAAPPGGAPRRNVTHRSPRPPERSVGGLLAFAARRKVGDKLVATPVKLSFHVSSRAAAEGGAAEERPRKGSGGRREGGLACVGERAAAVPLVTPLLRAGRLACRTQEV